MRHVKSKIRFMETFAIATFPIALAVGCSATSDKTDNLPLQKEVAIEQQTVIDTKDLDTVTYLETQPTIAQDRSNPWSATQPDETSQHLDTAESKPVDHTIHSTIDSELSHTLPVKLQTPKPDITPPQSRIFHFAFNKYNIDDQDYEVLKQHARFLQDNPEKVVRVNGYSDNRGSAKNNVAISEKRAQRIADILITFGVPESQIQVHGYGESFPLNDENNWDENRRVELQYPEDSTGEEIVVSIQY